MRALVAGWFSFAEGHATAGDILAADVVRQWLSDAGIPSDLAVVPPMGEGVDWRSVAASSYTHVVFVCGPFQRGELELEFLQRFVGCRLVGVDLTMLDRLSTWNPFDFLIERDSDRRVNPDVALASRDTRVPVVGLCRVEEYAGAQVAEADAAIDRLVAAYRATFVEIDTRLDYNSTGLRSAAEVESVISRMDAVVTTRLHGMVLSLKYGVPVVAIDPEAGGAKVRRQAERLGWQPVFNVDGADAAALKAALDYCLSEEARERARGCRSRGLARIEEMRAEMLSALAPGSVVDTLHSGRVSRLVSVVIPCYNQAQYLTMAIESVLAQSHREFEIVVVDDGSSDDTSRVAAQYPGVRVIRQANAGLSAARNAGLAACRGEYVVFLDADDRLLPNALQSGLNCLSLHPEAAFVSGHFRYVSHDGTPLYEFDQEPLDCSPYEGMLRGNYIAMHSTVMFRRAIFADVGAFDPSMRSCEDYDLYMRITRRHPVARHPEIVSEYRRHDASMSVRVGRMLDTTLDVLAAQRSHIRDDPRLIRACQAGIRGMRRDLLRPLLSSIRGAAKAGDWPRATALSRQLPGYVVPALRSVWLDLGLTMDRLVAIRAGVRS